MGGGGVIALANIVKIAMISLTFPLYLIQLEWLKIQGIKQASWERALKIFILTYPRRKKSCIRARI